MRDSVRRLSGIASAGVLVLGLAACSQLPVYQRPDAPIPAQWPMAEANAPALAEAPVWETYFADPQLRQLIAMALVHNRDLRIAVLNIQQARAQLGIRQADQLPTVNAVLAGSRAPAASGGIVSTYTGGLTISAYEVDLFGRVASLKDQALAQYLATQEGATSARLSLITTVAQTWISLLADAELLQGTGRTLVSREDSLRLVGLRYQHGVASELELRSAESLVQAARAIQAQQQRQLALDENALALLLGQAVPNHLKTWAHQLAGPANGSGLAMLQLPELPSGLPSDLLTRRPDIRQAEQQLVAANANIGAARAAFFPRISLTLGLGSASTELSGLFKDGSWGFTLAPQLLAPIFDAGRNQANLDNAEATRDVALAQYEKTIQAAFREVSDALASRESLERQRRALVAQAQAEEARLRLTEARLQAGVASQLEWLDAQRSVFAAQQAVVQGRLATLQNQVVLYKALGGGLDTR